MKRDPRKHPRKGDMVFCDGFVREVIVIEGLILEYRSFDTSDFHRKSKRYCIASSEWYTKCGEGSVVLKTAERDPITEPQEGDCWLRTSAGDTIIEVIQVLEGVISWRIHPLGQQSWGYDPCHAAANLNVALSQWFDFAKEMVLLRTSEGFVLGKDGKG